MHTLCTVTHSLSDTHTRTHAHARARTHTHTHTQMCMHLCVCTCMRLCVHACVCVWMHVFVYACVITGYQPASQNNVRRYILTAEAVKESSNLPSFQKLAFSNSTLVFHLHFCFETANITDSSLSPPQSSKLVTTLR